MKARRTRRPRRIGTRRGFGSAIRAIDFLHQARRLRKRRHFSVTRQGLALARGAGIAAYAVLRAGEVVGLRWVNVNLGTNLLFVRESMTYGIVVTPKSGHQPSRSLRRFRPSSRRPRSTGRRSAPPPRATGHRGPTGGCTHVRPSRRRRRDSNPVRRFSKARPRCLGSRQQSTRFKRYASLGTRETGAHPCLAEMLPRFDVVPRSGTPDVALRAEAAV